MAQPPTYTRQYNFNDYSTSNPSSPHLGSKIDLELDTAKTTMDALKSNLGLIQRDDGKLRNLSVHTEALSNAVLTLIKATENGYSVKGAFAPNTAYAVGDLVDSSQATYLCFNATSGGSSFQAVSSNFILLANAAIQTTASAVDTLSGDGSTQTFTLSSNSPSGVTDVLVFVNGSLRTPTTDYTIPNNTQITFTTAPSSGTNNVIVWGTSTVVEAAKQAAQAARDTALGYQNVAQDQRDTAESYAVETGAVVKHFSGASSGTSGTGTDQTGVYSAKEHAVGTSVDTGSAKDWASKSTTQVASTDFSAKEYAVGSATASSKGYSNTAEDTQVPGGASSDRSALHYREKAKDFATKTSGQVTGDTGTADQGYSAKEWALGTQTRGVASGGSAKDWATYTAGTVDDTGRSAKYHAEEAATSLTNFRNDYLGDYANDAAANSASGVTVSVGSLYFNTTTSKLKVCTDATGTPSWANATSAVEGVATISEFTPNGTDTHFAFSHDVGLQIIFLNGVRLIQGTDYNSVNSSSSTSNMTSGTASHLHFSTPPASGDVLSAMGFGTVTSTVVVPKSGGAFTGAISGTDLTLSGNLTVSGSTTTVDTTVTVSDAMVVNNAGSDVGLKINSTSSGHIMQLQDNGTDVMVVADGGKVGIGTTPEANSSLHIDSTGYQPLIVNTTAVGGGGLTVRHSGTQKAYFGSAGSTHLTGSSTDDALIRATGNFQIATGGNTERLKIDSSGSITTPNSEFNGTIGSSATVPASVGSSLVFLEKFTGSGNAYKDFDFTAYTTYSEYLFVFNGFQPATNGADLNVYLGSSDGSGGTTYASNTDDYRIPIRRWYYGGSNNSLTAVDDSVNTFFAFASSVNASTNYPGVNGHMSVFVPRSSNKFTGNVFDYASWTSNDVIYRYVGGGWRRSQIDNTHIRFVWSSGTILAGSINMYGVKDA